MKYSVPIRNTLILASIGFVVTLLVGYVFQNMQTTYDRNMPYVKLGDYLKNSTIQVRLNLERGIEGSPDVDYKKDVVGGLTTSNKLLQGVIDGQETILGKFWQTNDEETIAIIKKLNIDIENLILLADQRWEARNATAVVESTFSESDSTFVSDPISTVSTGPSALDQKFDASYTDLQLTLDSLVDHVTKRVQAEATFLSVLSWISVILIFIIFSFVSFFTYRIFYRNEKLAVESKVRLDQEIQRVNTLSNFIQAVSTGDYSIEIDSTDDLSNKLIGMRDTLRNNAEEDKRRNWATSGEAQIGEILRASGNIVELYDNIITFVVKYTKSNQGGLFLLNDENEQDTYLELVSCYAFERKKFIKKRVELGQGLVGQCYLEGARIHLRQIPDEYVHITSGLGGANPNSLLVIPMRVNEKTYGVIELASFKKYEEHEIIMVEKFAESIGAAVSSVKINESTRILLEKTQQQTEEMRAQEEEMRQNMEELEATQEEMRRKEKHVQDLLDEEKIQNEERKKEQSQLIEREKVLSLTTILSEADAAGTITYANDKLVEVSKYSREEMLGRGHNLFRHPDMPKELFKLLWDTIKDRKPFRGIVKNRAKDGAHYWVDATIVPVYENGVFVKYISARYHIVDDQLALELYNKQAIRLGFPVLSS